MALTIQNSEQISHFISTVHRLINRSSDESVATPKIGLAVSGGPDSMALLWLMKHHYDGDIFAATIDHGLRKEAAQEALHVAALCQKLEIQHDILTPAMPITGNIQSNARKARYTLLEQWVQQKGCDYIATAHHADDQLETMIMRLNRASGIAGLAAIRERNGKIIRPLLGFRKTDLIQICNVAAIETINDPSNANDDFDRVKIRQWLEKCEANGLELIIDPIMAQKSALHLEDANNAIEYSSAILAKERISQKSDTLVLDIADLPMEYQRRLLTQGLQQIDASIKPRGTSLEKSIKSLNNRNISMVGDIKITPKRTDKDSNKTLWILSKAPPRHQR